MFQDDWKSQVQYLAVTYKIIDTYFGILWHCSLVLPVKECSFYSLFITMIYQMWLTNLLWSINTYESVIWPGFIRLRADWNGPLYLNYNIFLKYTVDTWYHHEAVVVGRGFIRLRAGWNGAEYLKYNIVLKYYTVEGIFDFLRSSGRS